MPRNRAKGKDRQAAVTRLSRFGRGRILVERASRKNLQDRPFAARFLYEAGGEFVSRGSGIRTGRRDG